MFLLLLLRSPAISLRFTILGEIFAYVTVFNPTIEVVTFRLCGWCMLGVILLLAFTHPGHECQDLFCLCDEMVVSTNETSVYTQGCHWTFAKITENLRVRAVSQKMNTKRDRKRKMK